MSQSAVSIAETRHAPRPTLRQWLVHALFFLLTAFTTTVCGIMMAGPELNANIAAPPGLRAFAGSPVLIPWYYVATVAAILRYAIAHPHYLAQGITFSGSLLAILAAHES